MLSKMNLSKRILVLSFVVLFAFLAGGCVKNIKQPADNVTPTTGLDGTSTSLAHTMVAQTMVAMPTATVISTYTPLTPTPSPLPFQVVDRLRLAYIIDGNLYFQADSRLPLQLTHSGEDLLPVFSDDGQKIVFFRGRFPYGLYSINADGSQEKAIVTGDILISLNVGYSNKTEPRSLAFVPGTHQLLFNTHELDSRAIETGNIQYRYNSAPNLDLLLVDTDTAEIHRLLSSGKGGPFRVSPNGKMVGVQAADHIDVIELNGKIIFPNLTVYPLAYPYIWAPEIHWSQDSSILNVVFPIATAGILDYTGPEPRTIWQHQMGGNKPIEIHFNPPPIGDSFNISPDGNWIVYTCYYYEGKTDKTVVAGIYIGNLRDGSSQLIALAQTYGLPSSFSWSPDSLHFIFENEQTQMFLGDVSGTITSLNRGQFLGWIDVSHYLYGQASVGEIGKAENLIIPDIPTNIVFADPNYFTFILLNRGIAK